MVQTIQKNIRVTPGQWKRVKIAAGRRGITAAEFVRNAAQATVESESGTFPPEISARIERIYRGVYLPATLERDETNRDGRREELERTMKAARESQDSITEDASE